MSDRSEARSGMARLLCMAMLIAIAFMPTPSSAGTQYAYDDLGRLIQAINDDGTATLYQYDANGNITSITRQSVSTLSISGLSPLLVRAGASVTITGTAFGASANENAVVIGGIAASVVSASPNVLVVSVPQGTNSGVVSVTVGGMTAVAPQPLAILRPTISAFSPTLVNAGTLVTLTGANLNLVPGSTTVTVGGAAVNTVQVANTSISFTAPAASGQVRVNTPYGQATSAGALIAVPASINAANVVALATVVPGGSAEELDVAASSKHGLLAFDAEQGDYLSVQIGNFLVSPGNSSIGFQVYSPSGSQIASGVVSSSARSIHLPVIPLSGSYFVAFGSGTGTFQLSASVEVNTDFDGSGALAVSTIAGQSKRFIVSANSGQSIGVGVKGLVLSPNVGWINVALYRPDGAYVWGRACYVADPLASCGLPFFDLPQTGKYVLYATPGSAAGMSFDLTVSQAITNTLVPGSSLSAVNSAPGEFNLMSFTATAGQTFAVHVGGISTNPSNVNMYIAAYGPNGTQIINQSTTSSVTFNLANLSAGTHKVLVVPYFGVTGTAQVTLAPGMGGSLPVDASTASFSSTVPSQVGYFHFNAAAGEDIGIGLTGLVNTPSSVGAAQITLRAPNGSLIVQRNCYTWDPLGSCALQMIDAPESGVYSITVWPLGAATMAFNLTLSEAQSGSFTLDTPQTVSSSVPGQFALLSFNAAAQQSFAVNLSSIATTPPGVNTYMALINASGANILNQATASGTIFNLSNLSAGAYRILWVPYFAVTGSAQVTLAPGATGTLPVDGSTSSFSTSVPGQAATYTIAATAGDDIGIGLTNLLLNSGVNGSINLSLYAPNGAYMWGRPCYTWDPLSSCGLQFVDVPLTGNYQLVATPSGSLTMTFDLTASHALMATLVPGTPQSMTTTVPGQFVIMSFAATGGQTGGVSINPISTTPSNVNTYAAIYNPSAFAFTNQSHPGGIYFNLPGLTTGTYRIVWVPYFAVTGSAQFSLTLN